MLQAEDIRRLISIWAAIMEEKRDYLIGLDSVVGDGDLGLTMSDGFRAAKNAACGNGETDIGKLLYFSGKAMSEAVPSTMGTLMASGLVQAGKALKGQLELDTQATASLFREFFNGVQLRGKAQVGDKTFLDGLAGAVDVLEDAAKSGADEVQAAGQAAKRAEQDFLATHGMKAVHGRAAARGEASRDLLDPGAAVAALLMEGYRQFRAN